MATDGRPLPDCRPRMIARAGADRPGEATSTLEPVCAIARSSRGPPLGRDHRDTYRVSPAARGLRAADGPVAPTCTRARAERLRAGRSSSPWRTGHMPPIGARQRDASLATPKPRSCGPGPPAIGAMCPQATEPIVLTGGKPFQLGEPGVWRAAARRAAPAQPCAPAGACWPVSGVEMAR